MFAPTADRSSSALNPDSQEDHPHETPAACPRAGMRSGEALALFDLDGVLSRRDTMATLVIRVLRTRPWRVLAVVPLVVAAAAASPAGDLRPRLNRALVRIALRGMTRETYDRLARSTGAALAGNPRVPSEPLRARVRQELERARVVVVTASEQTLARAFVDGLGLTSVEVIGSRLRDDGAGLRIAFHNVGRHKVGSLRLRGLTLDGATLYTDSASDLPLARVVWRTVLVNGGMRSRRLFRRNRRVSTEVWRVSSRDQRLTG